MVGGNHLSQAFPRLFSLTLQTKNSKYHQMGCWKYNVRHWDLQWWREPFGMGNQALGKFKGRLDFHLVTKEKDMWIRLLHTSHGFTFKSLYVAWNLSRGGEGCCR